MKKEDRRDENGEFGFGHWRYIARRAVAVKKLGRRVAGSGCYRVRESDWLCFSDLTQRTRRKATESTEGPMEWNQIDDGKRKLILPTTRMWNYLHRAIHFWLRLRRAVKWSLGRPYEPW